MPSPRQRPNQLIEDCIVRLTELQEKQAGQIQETDPWIKAVAARLGTDFPKELRQPTTNDLLDIRVAGCPFMLLLLFGKTLRANWLEHVIAAGELTRKWRATVTMRWLPRDAHMASSDEAFIRNFLEDLEEKLLTLVRAYYRWPEAEDPAMFLLEHESALEDFRSLVKEIMGKNISVTSGRAAARAFYAAFRLQNMSKATPASLSSAISKVTVKHCTDLPGGNDAARKRERDGEHDRNAHRGGRGGGPRKRGGRGGGRADTRGDRKGGRGGAQDKADEEVDG